MYSQRALTHIDIERCKYKLSDVCVGAETMLTRPGEYFVPATTGVMARTAEEGHLLYLISIARCIYLHHGLIYIDIYI